MFSAFPANPAFAENMAQMHGGGAIEKRHAMRYNENSEQYEFPEGGNGYE